MTAGLSALPGQAEDADGGTLVIDTRRVEARERFSYWNTIITRLCGPREVIRCDKRSFHGTIRRSRLGPLVLSLNSGDPIALGTQTAPADEDVKLYLNMAGQFVMGMGDREVSLQPGDLLLVTTDSPIYYTDCYGPQRWSHLVVSVPRMLLASHADRGWMTDGTCIAGQQGAGWLARRFFTDLATLPPESSHQHEARLASSALELVRMLLDQAASTGDVPAASPRQTLLRTIKWYIDAHLGDRDLRPDTVAKAHYISVRLLYKLFEDEGVGVAQWIRARRLERCRVELADPAFAGETVTTIAARWGFTSAPHFSRLFHDACGVSPTVYRDAWGQASSGGAAALQSLAPTG